jgi:hypothetical protein
MILEEIRILAMNDGKGRIGDLTGNEMDGQTE